jgi:molybdopterin-guanine dinucleotide biosynthesis protein MobB
VVSVVARSGTGKTTLLENLLPALKGLGLRVGVLKHHAHATPFDVPGKDTYRLAEAGADVVVGACAVQTAIFIPGNAAADLPGVINRHLGGVDLVLTEGYKRGPYPKIEVHRRERALQDPNGPALLCAPAELLAVVTDERLALPPEVPQFDLGDATGLAALLRALVLRHGRLSPDARQP